MQCKTQHKLTSVGCVLRTKNIPPYAIICYGNHYFIAISIAFCGAWNAPYPAAKADISLQIVWSHVKIAAPEPQGDRK
jgi:hypothetical protein